MFALIDQQFKMFKLPLCGLVICIISGVINVLMSTFVLSKAFYQVLMTIEKWHVQ